MGNRWQPKKSQEQTVWFFSPLTFLFCDQVLFSDLPSASMSQKHKKAINKKLKPLRNQNIIQMRQSMFSWQ